MLTQKNKRGLIKFLNRNFPNAEEHLRSGSNGVDRHEWRFVCPFCNGGEHTENCFDMNVDEGVGRCWRQKCGWGGGHIFFVSEMLGVTWDDAQKVISSEEPVSTMSVRMELKNMKGMIEDQYSVSAGDSDGSIFVEIESAIPLEESRIEDAVHDWISTERGYNVTDFLAQHEVWVPPQYKAWEGRVVFIVTTNDDVAYIMYAFDSTLENKTLNPHGGVLSRMLYNYNNVKKAKTVFITEGLFDCARLMSWGFKAVAAFGVALQPAQALLLDDLPAKEICVCFDYGTQDKMITAMKLLDSVVSDDKVISCMIIEKEGLDPDSLSEELFEEYYRKRMCMRRGETQALSKKIGAIDVEQWF